MSTIKIPLNGNAIRTPLQALRDECRTLEKQLVKLAQTGGKITVAFMRKLNKARKSTGTTQPPLTDIVFDKANRDEVCSVVRTTLLGSKFKNEGSGNKLLNATFSKDRQTITLLWGDK